MIVETKHFTLYMLLYPVIISPVFALHFRKKQAFRFDRSSIQWNWSTSNQ